MRVYLTGFMASGKSALGRALAREIGFEFLDLDVAIEAAAGRSISEIFGDGGEPAFRAVEKASLLNTETLHNYVIAAGGGTLVPDANMDWALAHGVVVFLDLPVEEIVRRLLRSRTRRPLVDAMRSSPAELERYVCELLDERRAAYERAHLCVRLGASTVARNARMLGQLLRPMLRDLRTDSPD